MISDYYKASLEHKFCNFDSDLSVVEGVRIQGYASLFGQVDRGNDVVSKGAYGKSLGALTAAGRSVKMLWQHDPAAPIGIWDEVREDKRGLYVKGRILPEIARGREAIALIEAGAIDGLSIGYRTVKATKNSKGERVLEELELWEVSLVTFPMLSTARVAGKGDALEDGLLREMADILKDARLMLAPEQRRRP